jgi:hypothetical protein
VVPFDVQLIGYPQCVVGEPDGRLLVMLLKQEKRMRAMAKKLNLDIDDEEDDDDEAADMTLGEAKMLAAAQKA